jgi:hypothetical protein
LLQLLLNAFGGRMGLFCLILLRGKKKQNFGGEIRNDKDLLISLPENGS